MPLLRRKIAAGTIAMFLLTAQVHSPSLSAQYLSLSPEIPKVSANDLATISMPAELASVDEFAPGSGPVIFHIQTPHGNYEAQKKIESILQRLHQEHDVDLIFVEGSAFPLNPGLTRFFSEEERNARLLDRLAERSVAKGAELFLAKFPDVRAYGIEDLDAYNRNGEAFYNVLSRRKLAAEFLEHQEQQMQGLAGHSFSPAMRQFLKQQERYEQGTLAFSDWIQTLTKAAEETLRKDFHDPLNQIEFPMITRLVHLTAGQGEWSPGLFESQRAEFLDEVSNFAPDLYSEVRDVLKDGFANYRTDAVNTALLFERLLKQHPRIFDNSRFNQVKLHIGQIILRSEIKPEGLRAETTVLTQRVVSALCRTEAEEKLAELFEDYRLLKRLFVLALTPDDYDKLMKKRDQLNPERLSERFHDLNADERVKFAEFENTPEIEALYHSAVIFYESVRARDPGMLARIFQEIDESGEKNAAVITGGFHKENFRNFFEARGFSYVLLTPRISSSGGRNAYEDNLLRFLTKPYESATYEDAYYLTTPAAGLALQNRDAAAVVRTEILPAIRQEAEVSGLSSEALKKTASAMPYLNQETAGEFPREFRRENSTIVYRSDIREPPAAESMNEKLLLGRIEKFKETPSFSEAEGILDRIADKDLFLSTPIVEWGARVVSSLIPSLTLREKAFIFDAYMLLASEQGHASSNVESIAFETLYVDYLQRTFKEKTFNTPSGIISRMGGILIGYKAKDKKSLVAAFGEVLKNEILNLNSFSTYGEDEVTVRRYFGELLYQSANLWGSLEEPIKGEILRAVQLKMFLLDSADSVQVLLRLMNSVGRSDGARASLQLLIPLIVVLENGNLAERLESEAPESLTRLTNASNSLLSDGDPAYYSYYTHLFRVLPFNFLLESTSSDTSDSGELSARSRSLTQTNIESVLPAGTSKQKIDRIRSQLARLDALSAAVTHNQQTRAGSYSINSLGSPSFIEKSAAGISRNEADEYRTQANSLKSVLASEIEEAFGIPHRSRREVNFMRFGGKTQFSVSGNYNSSIEPFLNPEDLKAVSARELLDHLEALQKLREKIRADVFSSMMLEASHLIHGKPDQRRMHLISLELYLQGIAYELYDHLIEDDSQQSLGSMSFDLLELLFREASFSWGDSDGSIRRLQKQIAEVRVLDLADPQNRKRLQRLVQNANAVILESLESGARVYNKASEVTRSQLPEDAWEDYGLIVYRRQGTPIFLLGEKLLPHIQAELSENWQTVTAGRGIIDGVAEGKAVFDFGTAAEMKRAGHKTVLIRRNGKNRGAGAVIPPSSRPDGLITVRGGARTQLADLFFGWGIPVLGGIPESVAVKYHGNAIEIAGQKIHEGDWISINTVSAELRRLEPVNESDRRSDLRSEGQTSLKNEEDLVTPESRKLSRDVTWNLLRERFRRKLGERAFASEVRDLIGLPRETDMPDVTAEQKMRNFRVRDEDRRGALQVLGQSTGSEALYYVIGPEFAFEYGGLVTLHAVFGDKPFAVIVDNESERQIVEDYNERILAPEARTPIQIIEKVNGQVPVKKVSQWLDALTGSRPAGVKSIQAILGSGDLLLAESLRETVGDNYIVMNENMFRRFSMTAALDEIVRIFQSEFAILRSA